MTDASVRGKLETTFQVPIKLVQRGGRKLIVVPDNLVGPDYADRRDPTLIKAVARGFRWRRLLDEGVHATISEIAQSEQINQSYVSRILRLNLLAPDIVLAILDGRQPVALQLEPLLKPFPFAWDEQRVVFGFVSEQAPAS